LRGGVGGKVGPRDARLGRRAQVEKRAAADGQPAVLQRGIGDGHHGRGELGQCTLAHGAPPPEVDREAFAVPGGLQERDLDRLVPFLFADFPAAHIGPFHPLDEIVAGDLDAEHLALTPPELERQPPDEPQPVLLDVQDGRASGGEAAIDQALGHLGAPLDAHGAARAQGRLDRQIGPRASAHK